MTTRLPRTAIALAAALTLPAAAHAATPAPLTHVGVGPNVLADPARPDVAATQVMSLRGAVAAERRDALRLAAEVDLHPPVGTAELGTTSVSRLRELDRLWERRADRYEAALAAGGSPAAADPAVVAGFDCIRAAESAGQADPYRTHTGNGYYGAYQLDLGFQRTYGGEYLAAYGTADAWPPEAQLTAVLRAYYGYAGHPGRGFTPWPNTAAACGLL